MANRYWVGGTGDWDASTTTHWSATSGGAGGASVPTSADAVTLNASSGGGTVTITATASCLSLAAGAFTGTLNTNGQTVNCTNAFSISGSGTRTITLGASTIVCGTWTATTTTGLTFNCSTSTIKFINPTNPVDVYFNGGGLTYYNLWFSRGGATSGSNIIVGSNTFNDIKDDGTLAHSLLFPNSSTQTVSTFTVNGTAGELITLAPSVATGGRVLTFTIINNGTGYTGDYIVNLIGGNNDCYMEYSFGTWKVMDLMGGSNYEAGVTYETTIVMGTPATGLQIRVDTVTPVEKWSISDSTGTNTVSYCLIKNSTAIGGATWNANDGTSTDGGGNTGWDFTPEPSPDNTTNFLNFI